MTRFGQTLALSLIFAATAAAHAAEYRTGDDIVVRGSFSDNLFAAGGRIEASCDSSDDVYLAGGTLTFAGNTDEDLNMAGGDVTVSRGKAREALLFGGKVRIEELQLADDLVVAGGNVIIGAGSRVAGTSTVAGGDVEFAGAAAGDATIYGGKVTLSGRFSRNVTVRADTLVILAGATVEGNLVHAARKVEIAPEARILGTRTAEPLPERRGWKGGKAFGILGGILFFLGGVLIPALAAVLFPRTMEQGRQSLRTDYWATLGKGTLFLIALPFALVLLFATVVGIPAALAALPFLGVGAILAWAIVAFALGDELRNRFRARSKSRFLWTAAGALALAVIVWIPVLGALAWLVAFLSGAGAVFTLARAALPRTR